MNGCSKSREPGMREDELAVELKWHMKTLGAEDNFLMLCAGSHNPAVQPSSGRRLEVGDIILAEITPSYMGQMAQICRTAVIGPANEPLKRGYELVVRSMEEGIATAVAGATMADVCRAIDSVLEAKGYGEYCRPPHIRRRGHGLGFGSNSTRGRKRRECDYIGSRHVFRHPSQSVSAGDRLSALRRAGSHHREQTGDPEQTEGVVG